LDIADANMTYINDKLILNSGDKLFFVDLTNPAPDDFIQFNSKLGQFDPVAFVDTVNSTNNCIFIQTDAGDIYKINNNEKQKIFSLYPYTDHLPTNLALGNLTAQGSPVLCFAAGSWLFAINTQGSFLDGFPKLLENNDFKPFSYPRIIEFNSEIILLFETNSNGYLALDAESNLTPQYNIFWPKTQLEDHFYIDQQTNELTFIYADNSPDLYASSLGYQGNNNLIWSGFRNNTFSIYYGQLMDEQQTAQDLIAYAYPNPATRGEVRIKVIDDKDKISLKIFDVSGNIVFNKNYDLEYYSQKDLIWDTRKIASGIYFGIIKSGNQAKKIPIAVEN